MGRCCISPLCFGLVGVALGALTVWVILRFDRPFIKALDETNEREHVVSATLFDSLSNIITVITLRLEKRIQAVWAGKIGAVFPPFMRQVKINEWKWFAASILVSADLYRYGNGLCVSALRSRTGFFGWRISDAAGLCKPVYECFS